MTQGVIKTQHGITLIELVVVIAIMSIIASVAVPSFTSSIAQARLKLVVETLKSDLIDAQRSVLAHGAAGSATTTFVDGSSWSYTITGSKSLSRDHSQFSGSVTMTSSFASDTFTITQKTQNHQEAATVGSIVINNSDASVTISQSAAGMITVCSNDSMGYPSC
ncbi:prepilin-type N-terminal cleavage/methylation domain-containing protein [Luminiphilus sp.]|nr:prepilin-type N-terminal cleavage/methylation domain-containing protein [Luminiphilus sp.]